ncbi:MAG: DUF2148 domain-containing protein [Candidatus Thermoplasmatota archaeon]
MDSALRTVAELMALSARTAPKAMGQDFLELKICTGEEVERLAAEMLRIANEHRDRGFARDAGNVRDSQAVVLIGLKPHAPLGLNCAACGYGCAAFEHGSVERGFAGPNCAMRLLDMGIAVGSAVKTASIHNVDNRVMYRAGVAARRAGLIDAAVVMGIPLSAKGKSIYFDRAQ